MEGIVKTFRRHPTHEVHQPHCAVDDSEHIKECTEKNLNQFSQQIVTVQERYMTLTLVKDGYIPWKPTQWVKEATDLESQVKGALKEKQNNKDRYEKLMLMHNKMIDFMKHCPLEGVALIACIHEIRYDRKGKHTITGKGHSQADRSDGHPILEVNSKPTITSQVHDAVAPEISLKDSTSPYISQVEDEKKNEPSGIQEVGALEGTVEKNLPEPKAESSSYSHERKHHEEIVTRPTQTDDLCLGMTIPISLTGEVSLNVQLSLQVVGMSPSQETFNLNNVFGLDRKMDQNYMFSAIEKPEDLEAISQSTLVSGRQQPSGALEKTHTNGTSLKSRSTSKVMPKAEECHRARVINLIEENMLLLDEKLDCPYLVILFLQRNRRLTHIPPTFFNQMPSLHFLDLSYTRIRALPSSLFMLTNLQVLLLRSCVCLDNLPADVKNLKNMKVLELSGTDLSDLPKEIGELTQLQHLELSLYRPDHGSKTADSQSELVSSGAILQLQALQGLSIAVNHKDQYWERIVEDIIKQIGKLKMLSYLQFYFPTVKDLKCFSEVSLSWKEQGLRSFKFLVGLNIKRITSRVPDEVESQYEQYDRCLKFVNGNEVPEVIKGILKCATAFYLDHHLEIQSLSEFDNSSFQELKFCVLRECPNIQVMIIGDKRDELYFPKLEYLGLHYLWKLERIWEDPVRQGSYKALKYLRIGTCGMLKYVASHSILQGLINLEKFIIEDCESLERIVKEKEMAKYEEAHLLPRLKELVLHHLPQLVDLGRGLFPSEDIISIYFCPKLILRPRHSREWKKLLESTICNSAQT